MMMYFFHNVYGDEQELLETLPEGVIAVPFGWTEEVEANRNRILESLGTSVSSLPCVVFYVPEHFSEVSASSDGLQGPLDHRSLGLHKFPARWVELSILGMPKPWSWDSIIETVTNFR